MHDAGRRSRASATPENNVNLLLFRRLQNNRCDYTCHTKRNYRQPNCIFLYIITHNIAATVTVFTRDTLY